MGRRRTKILVLAALVVCSAAVPNAGFAQERAYVGTWAANRAQCRVGQDKQEAPLILTRNGYDQHETHCKFASVRANGSNTWRVRARCSVEGDTQQHDLTLVVAGSSLTIRDKRGNRVLRRCN